MTRFRLKMRATEITLPMGQVLIGRGPECFLRIDEPVVSRRHARLTISEEEVIFEDLGSRNGSKINGFSAAGRIPLRPGDVIAIATQQFTLESAPTDEGAAQPQSGRSGERMRSRTPYAVGPVDLRSTEKPEGNAAAPLVPMVPLPLLSSGHSSLGQCPSCGAPQGDAAICPRCGHAHRHDFSDAPATTTERSMSHHLFWGLSDKVLAMGRVEDAERMMAPRLQDMLDQARAGTPAEPALVGDTLARVLKLAAVTRKDEWYAWIFEYARLCRHRMTLVLLDEIYAQMFAHRPRVSEPVLEYARSLSDQGLITRLLRLRKLCSD